MRNMEEILAGLKERFGQITPTSQASSAYKCEKCHDSGWLEYRDEQGRSFARKCSCRLAREAEERMRCSGLSDALDAQTFDAFITRTDMQKLIKSSARKYLDALFAENNNPRKPWFYIGGNPGCGKTHICTAICGEILKRNIAVRYMQWLDISRKLKAFVNDEDFEDEVAEYTGISVLYIDDLLKQKYTETPAFSDADIKIAFTILNSRYIQNKPTIISSEWSLIDQLLPADEGVFSRVYERSKGFAVDISRKRENNFRTTDLGGVPNEKDRGSADHAVSPVQLRVCR